MTPVGSDMAALTEMRRVNNLFYSFFHSMSFNLSIICHISTNPRRLAGESVIIHDTSREPLTSYHKCNSSQNIENLTKQSSVPFHPHFNAADVLCCYHWLKSGNNVQVMGR